MSRLIRLSRSVSLSIRAILSFTFSLQALIIVDSFGIVILSDLSGILLESRSIGSGGFFLY